MTEKEFNGLICREIEQLLMEDNPGLLPDEAYRQATMMLFRNDIYEKAKRELFDELDW